MQTVAARTRVQIKPQAAIRRDPHVGGTNHPKQTADFLNTIGAEIHLERERIEVVNMGIIAINLKDRIVINPKYGPTFARDPRGAIGVLNVDRSVPYRLIGALIAEVRLKHVVGAHDHNTLDTVDAAI